jgi:PAS domain S-box-containing protein
VRGAGAGAEAIDDRRPVATGDMIYTLDREGRFTYLNSAGLQLLGYDAGELLGRHFAAVLTPGSAEVAGDHFSRGLEGTEATPFFEVQAVRKDGRVVDMEVRAGNLLSEDGTVIGRQGVARDIGALKALQSQAAETSERIEGSARVATDLYRRIAEMTLAGPADPESTDRALRMIEDSIIRASAEKLGLDEQDVVIAELLANGCSTRQIAEQVHLRPNTVNDRISKLMRALDTRSRAGVVARAARTGLIGGDGG